MATDTPNPEGARARGRPRLRIDRDAVADAVAELLDQGGLNAVTMTEIAERLAVSRATLYRAVRKRQDLIGALFERNTRDLTDRAKAILREVEEPDEQLRRLIMAQADAAVRMRSYMPVFFGGGDLPADVYARWQSWSQRYDKLWVEVVAANMAAGYLRDGDAIVTTRLILGMVIWVSRWYRTDETVSPRDVGGTAIKLLGLRAPESESIRHVRAPNEAEPSVGTN